MTETAAVLLAAAAVLTAGGLVGRRWGRGLLEQLLLAGVTAACVIQAATLVPGVLGHLRRVPVLAATLTVTLPAVVLLRRQMLGLDIRRRRTRLWQKLSGRLTADTAFAGTVGTTVAAIVVWHGAVAVRLGAYAADGTFYHLPMMAWWVQEGAIGPVPLFPSPDQVWINVYPAASEVAATWATVLSGTPAFAETVQIPFALLGAVAVTALARSVGVSRTLAAAAGLLWLGTPALVAQLSTAYTDAATAGVFLAALALLARYLDRRSPALLVGFGAALGLTVAMKSTGLVYAAVAAAAAVALTAATSRTRRLQSAAKVVAVAGPAALLVGGYWYLRNWVAYGNPLYPFEIELAGRTVFDGIMPLSSSDWSHLVPRELVGDPASLQVLRNWFDPRLVWGGGAWAFGQRLGGFGPVWLLMAPAGIGFIAWAVRRRSVAAAALLIPVAVSLLLQPAAWWARYTVWVVAPGAVALVWVIQRLPRTAARATQTVTSVLVVAMAGALLAIPTGTQILPAPQVARMLVAPEAQRTTAATFSPAWEWVDQLPDGSRIMLDPQATLPAYYPVFGMRLQHQVVAVSGAADAAAKLGDVDVVYGWPDSPAVCVAKSQPGGHLLVRDHYLDGPLADDFAFVVVDVRQVADAPEQVPASCQGG